MLKKDYRLTGKQINRLMGRGRKLYGKYFICVVFPQRHYIQKTHWSITIPVKLDKRATMRNALKRRAREEFIDIFSGSFQTHQWQIFIFLNKKSLEELKQLVATHEKTPIYKYWHDVCRNDFLYFFKKICVS